MHPSLKKLGIPLAVGIGGTAFLIGTWWMNGAQADELWIYFISIWLMLYAAWELYRGLNKKKQ